MSESNFDKLCRITNEYMMKQIVKAMARENKFMSEIKKRKVDSNFKFKHHPNGGFVVDKEEQ